MKKEELVEKIRIASDELFGLGKQAEKFEGCDIMYIASETLKGMSYSLDAIVYGLVGDEQPESNS